MINKVILVGNLGQNPEVRTTQGGNSVARLRIATTERRKDKDGNWSDHTEWHSVVLWGRNAENAGKYLQKGRQVYIEGRLQTQKWQDRNGQDRYTTEVVGEVIKFLGGGGGGGGGDRPGRGEPREPSGGGGRDMGGDEGPSHRDDPMPFDDELPF